jgi:uncharacterized protein (TIGR02145 family)
LHIQNPIYKIIKKHFLEAMKTNTLNKIAIFFLIITAVISGCSKDNDNSIDHTPPFCAISNPKDNAKFTQGVEITLKARTEGRDSDLAIERFLINDAIAYETNSTMNGWYEYDWKTVNEDHGLFEIRFQAVDSLGSIAEDTILIELLPADTIEDIEGNRYRTIQIADQTWMAKNLKTTTYNDGTPIELITNNDSWSSTTNGAYSWYDNDEGNGEIYGGLYNYYAIETDKLCPEGWHVPAYEEWDALEDYLIENGHSPCANALKADSVWGGIDEIWGYDYYGFKALPGGFRNNRGGFQHLDSKGFWWCPGEYFNFKSLTITESIILFGLAPKNAGYSVRCIKD